MCYDNIQTSSFALNTNTCLRVSYNFWHRNSAIIVKHTDAYVLLEIATMGSTKTIKIVVLIVGWERKFFQLTYTINTNRKLKEKYSSAAHTYKSKIAFGIRTWY